jgi:hypothetical protein
MPRKLDDFLGDFLDTGCHEGSRKNSVRPARFERATFRFGVWAGTLFIGLTKNGAAGADQRGGHGSFQSQSANIRQPVLLNSVQSCWITVATWLNRRWSTSGRQSISWYVQPSPNVAMLDWYAQARVGSDQGVTTHQARLEPN